MSEWTLHGEHVREQMDKALDPEELSYELSRYRKALGKDFGISDLIKIRDIQAKTRIAEAICNAPEYLMDQIGVARNSSNFRSITTELEILNANLEEYLIN